MSLRDFFGTEIKVGDTVVFMQLNYRNLLLGKVKSLAPQSVLIEHEKTNDCRTESRQHASQVIVKK